MKLLIEIQDDVYRALKEDIYPIPNAERMAIVFKTLVEKGTLLPKGHGKLIDSNVLWDAFQDLGQDFYEAFDFAEANAIIEADKEAQDETDRKG